MSAPERTAVSVPSLVGGERVDGDEWLERLDPADGTTVVALIGAAGAATVDQAVRRADAAWQQWRTVPVGARAALLADAASAIEPAAETIAIRLARELGKPVADCRAEVAVAVRVLRQSAVDGPAHLTERRPGSVGDLRIRYEPQGVVAAIVPWNAPLVLAATKIGPALLAGNTMVLKPSPVAASALTLLAGSMSGVLPAGVLNVVQGGVDTGRALVAHPLVRRIAFTGGRAGGVEVMTAAAQRVVPVSLELGGNDAAIVLDDVELTPDLLHRAVLGTFRTSGQVCMAAKRWLVHRSVLAGFVDGFVEQARTSLVVGHPLADGTTMGPVATCEQRALVRGLVEDAAGRGAAVREVGTVSDPALVDGRGWFLRPTVVLTDDDSWPIVRTEQFGPTVPIGSYTDLDEAVARANAVDVGLASSVWSADAERAFGVAERLEAGYTFINTHNLDGIALQAPFGGIKGSGFGREFAPETVLEYSNTHAMHLPPHARPGRA